MHKPIQALISFNGQGNTFDLNLKWARTLPLGIFHRILIEPRPLHKKKLRYQCLMYTSLTPSLFIEVPDLSQDGSFICVLGLSNEHISTIFLLNVGTVPTV